VTLLPAGLVLALAGPVIAAASHIGVQVSVITELILVVLVLGPAPTTASSSSFESARRSGAASPPRRRGARRRDRGRIHHLSALIVIGALLSLVIAQFGFYQGSARRSPSASP